MLVTAAEIMAFAPELAADAAKLVAEAINIEFPKGGITTVNRFWGMLSQTAAETGNYIVKRESLAYRPARLVAIFGPGISSARVTIDEAKALCIEGEKAIGNRVYGLPSSPKLAGELGNTQPDDGFTKRGFGVLQHTGRAITEYLAHHLNIADIEALPDMVANDFMLSFRAACLEWNAHGCSAIADTGNAEALTKRINGGLNGLEDRLAALARAQRIWPAETVKQRLSLVADVPVAALNTASRPQVQGDGQIVMAPPPKPPAEPTTAIKRRELIPPEARELLTAALAAQLKDGFTMFQYIVARASERSTYQGLLAIATGLGYTIAPDKADAIITVAVSLAGLLHVLFPESGSAAKG